MTDEPQGAAPATLDEVADALVERLLESMPPGGVYGRTALARLPGPVEHVLTAALDRKVARETAPPASDWIDADDPEVRDAARRWREAALEAARYPPDSWTAALSDGARQALRHLVEPAEAAAAFCFAGETGPLPIATVRARMSAFGPYPYLREIAERYADRKGLEHLDRAGLRSLLGRIDRRMTSGFRAGEWDALTAPLYALVGSLPGLDGRVPADVLRRFFAARGADELADAVMRRPAWGPAELHEAVTAIVGEGPVGAPLGGSPEETAEATLAGGPDATGDTSIVEAVVDAPDATVRTSIADALDDTPPPPLVTADAPEGTSQVEALGAPLVGAADATARASFGDDVGESSDASDALASGRVGAVPADSDNSDGDEVGLPEESLAGTSGASAGTEPIEEADRALAEHFGIATGGSHSPAPAELPTAERAPAAPAKRDAASTDEALWKTFAADRPAPAAPFAEVDVPDAEPLWQRLARTHGDQPAAGAGAPEPLSRLEARVLGPDALAQRDWFVANVAGGSEPEYRRLLEDLGAASTWADAWPVLARAFKAHAVDIYSEPAVALTDAVEARFGR